MSHFKVSHKDAVQVHPAGKYDASVSRVDETDTENRPLFSKKGEPMQKVVFECYTNERSFKISQYFTAKSMAYFYKKLAAALGAADQFKRDEFNALNYIGHNLVLELEVEEDKGYGEQNRIKNFEMKPVQMPGQATTTRVQAPRPRPVDNQREMNPDDIPFAPGCHLFA
jgi:hypothetical protein